MTGDITQIKVEAERRARKGLIDGAYRFFGLGFKKFFPSQPKQAVPGKESRQVLRRLEIERRKKIKFSPAGEGRYTMEQIKRSHRHHEEIPAAVAARLRGWSVPAKGRKPQIRHSGPTVTGRFKSGGPNVQNIVHRTEEVQAIRSALRDQSSTEGRDHDSQG